jgi:hypothetical protein
MVATDEDRLIRVACSECGVFRHFRESDLFQGDHPRCVSVIGDVANVTKACPSCATMRPLAIQRPSESLPRRVIWELAPFPVRPSLN